MRLKLFLISCSILILGSCSTDNTLQTQNAQIDSAVNANVSKHDAENVAKKDSILKAIELQRADSITQRAQLEEKSKAQQSVKTP